MLVRRLFGLAAKVKKFDPSRRRAFGAIGALAATPIAAKEAMDSEVARLTFDRATALAPALQYAGAPTSGDDYTKAILKAGDYINAIGVPDWVRDHYRRNGSYIQALDPDIAALRSFSMSVKIMMQRERNLERNIEYMKHQATKARKASAFKALTGWDWPF